MEEIKEISEIYFGIASPDEIREKSTYLANVSKYTDKKTNTVYDPRGGALFKKRCETCKNYEQLCPGHFGHIELNAVIIHPLFLTHVLNVLKIICHQCSKLVLSYDHLKFGNILKVSGKKRFYEILNKAKKFNKCFHCQLLKREYKLKKDVNYTEIQYYDPNTEMSGYLSDADVHSILQDIDEETISLLDIADPRNCCLEVFPVIPPCCRPYEFVGNVIKEDDLTKQLVEIIKVNNSIPKSTDKKAAINSLKLKIETYCRNPKNKTRHISSEPIKGIRERLTGKEGQLRENLMGKRTEMSSRTVIGPGPHLKVDEVGVPENIANTITFPIIVYEHNRSEILELINKGIVEKIKRGDQLIRIDLQRFSDIIAFLEVNDLVVRGDKRITVTDTKFLLKKGDRIIRNINGIFIDITPDELPTLKDPDIQVGDIAQRKILNGDWVLMNRQPTLHKGSMLAFKVVISKLKNFQFNPAVCKSFNSDFDGDEQNAHFPQSTEASIELMLLSSPEECLLSSSNGNPIIVILQDALLGAYLMSKENRIVPEYYYNDIIMCLSKDPQCYLTRKEEIRKTLKELNMYDGEHSLRTGKSLLSLIFPNTFDFNNEEVKIKNGVLYEGTLTKKYLGSSKNSFLFLLKNEYSNRTCLDFLNDIQFMTNKWLLLNSFSVHLDDCAPKNGASEKIREIISDRLSEAEFIKNTVLNPKLAEAKINLVLSNAKDVGMKMAMDKENNFVHTITSGSKGDYFNLGQVKGLLGQQVLNGKRIYPLLDNCTRSLPHYPKSTENLTDNYESRGFVCNSFYKGLNPKEFFFHNMCGRQGVCDTAMTTFMSGYNMRKLVKLTEDITIQNNLSVADSSGNTYSYAYGDLGINPENKNVDIERILQKFVRE